MGPDGLEVHCTTSRHKPRSLTYESHRVTYADAMLTLRDVIPLIFANRLAWDPVKQTKRTDEILPCPKNEYCSLYKDPFTRGLIQVNESGAYSLFFLSVHNEKYLFMSLPKEIMIGDGLKYLLNEECNPNTESLFTRRKF
jgi:hypothetical protein